CSARGTRHGGVTQVNHPPAKPGRFTYIGMAFLESGMQAATLAASTAVGRGGVQFNQFQGAGRQGSQSLFAEDTAIPPTLYRNQAEPIVVRLTQDLDMRPCFRLRAR
ncbi:hypothetical protein, partial [Belnapia arida]